MRTLTFGISTARNKIKCQGVVRIKCITESGGKESSILNGGHRSLLLIAKDTAMQIMSDVSDYSLPLFPIQGFLCAHLIKEGVCIPEMHSDPNSQAKSVNPQTSEQLKSAVEQ